MQHHQGIKYNSTHHQHYYIHARQANAPHTTSSAVLPESSPIKIFFFGTCFMSRFVVTCWVGISQRTTAYVLPVPVAPATDCSGQRSIHSAIEMFVTFIMYLLGESKPTANTFLGLGDEHGSCLLSKLRMEDGGGEEASNAKVASEETT